MVRIRLARGGAKKTPFYRIVVTDQRAPRGGRFIETIGTFDPLKKDAAVNVRDERLEYWSKQGAQISDTVAAVLRKRAIAAKAS